MQLLLYKLKFPGNVGAIYRLAYNFGIEKIWQIDCVKPNAENTPKIERYMPIENVNGIHEIPGWHNMFTIALEQHPDGDKDILKAFQTSNYLVAVGNEAHGIPEDELKKFDMIVSLQSVKPQSMNVSHALAIALYKILYG
jgi:tRNA G18 (ribose-2'-O)-methylase SpoU